MGDIARQPEIGVTPPVPNGLSMSMVTEGTASIVAALTALPARLDRLLRGRDEASVRRRPAPDAWSPLEILVHLHPSEAIIEPRLYQIIVREEPLLLAFDERRWADVAGYSEVPLPVLLDRFAVRRAEMVAFLSRLGPADWQRAGHHEVIGRVTVLDVAQGLIRHAAEHLAQLEVMLGEGPALPTCAS